jgi:hypothetical protein
VAAFAGAVVSVQAADEPGFKSLFNGKDLSGWDGDKLFWRTKIKVKDIRVLELK